MNDLTIVMPAYNEGESLPKFIPEVISFCEENGCYCIVVNDGSKDNTLQYLKSIHSDKFSYISHKLNRGYGGALKSGLAGVSTKYAITIDSDGQHLLSDVKRIFDKMISSDADMIVGSRKGQKSASWYRGVGKFLIRSIAGILMPLPIYDINSGMKMYDSDLCKRYLSLCPDTMAFSDTILLIFLQHRHLVLEEPITVLDRMGGVSTINTMTALDTIKQILNMVVLFNPMKIFLPISVFLILAGIGWGIPIVLKGNGVSVGALLAILSGVIFFFLGLLAEQISIIRRINVDKP